jgi:GT2 family glycosyltransferase
MQGDAAWSRRALDLGHSLTFAPDAVVDHHHLETLRSFLGERSRRGLEVGRMRREWERGHPLRLAAITVATVLPVRLLRIAGLVTWQCARAGCVGDLLRTAPVVAAGHFLSIAGEARALLERPARPGGEKG